MANPGAPREHDPMGNPGATHPHDPMASPRAPHRQAPIVILTLTQRGQGTARTIIQGMGADAPPILPIHGNPREALAQYWHSASTFVCCMALGATARLIAPYLANPQASKHTDPSVLVIDEAQRYVVTVTGAHHGGNEIAERLSTILGATHVNTTASDAHGIPSLDSLPTSHIRPEYDCRPALMRALIDGERMHLGGDLDGPIADTLVDHLLAFNPILVDEPTAPGIWVSTKDHLPQAVREAGVLVLTPETLVLGIGASKDCPYDELERLVLTLLATNHIHPRAVMAIATVDVKASEPAIQQLSATYAWPIIPIPASALASVEVPNPSEHALAAVGTPSVSEAAALWLTKGPLVCEKTRSTPQSGAAMATCAIAWRRIASKPLPTKGSS